MTSETSQQLTVEHLHIAQASVIAAETAHRLLEERTFSGEVDDLALAMTETTSALQAIIEAETRRDRLLELAGPDLIMKFLRVDGPAQETEVMFDTQPEFFAEPVAEPRRSPKLPPAAPLDPIAREESPRAFRGRLNNARDAEQATAKLQTEQDELYEPEEPAETVETETDTKQATEPRYARSGPGDGPADVTIPAHLAEIIEKAKPVAPEQSIDPSTVEQDPEITILAVLKGEVELQDVKLPKLNNHDFSKLFRRVHTTAEADKSLPSDWPEKFIKAQMHARGIST